MIQPYDGMDIRKFAWMKDLKEIWTAQGSFTINHKTGRLEKKNGPNVFKANSRLKKKKGRNVFKANKPEAPSSEPEAPSYWAACTIL
uniref:Uncharacterized protein n=1 Tax=Pristionchus pacificus TaxID=54126 RepID=A0A8R1UL59_PRIPA